MHIIRLFSSDDYKGQRGYLDTQKVYEIIRTILYFSFSLSIFFIGWFHLKTRSNLLSILAVLFLLPASKSAVNMIMFLRYKSCDRENADLIDAESGEMNGLYDCVFTSYEKNYSIAHLVVKGSTICGFSENKDFDEQSFDKHLNDILAKENYKNVSIKIFNDRKKYLERLQQLKTIDADETYTSGILETIKNVIL